MDRRVPFTDEEVKWLNSGEWYIRESSADCYGFRLQKTRGGIVLNRWVMFTPGNGRGYWVKVETFPNLKNFLFNA